MLESWDVRREVWIIRSEPEKVTHGSSEIASLAVQRTRILHAMPYSGDLYRKQFEASLGHSFWIGILLFGFAENHWWREYVLAFWCCTDFC
jgi:hypothetical protein